MFIFEVEIGRSIPVDFIAREPEVVKDTLSPSELDLKTTDLITDFRAKALGVLTENIGEGSVFLDFEFGGDFPHIFNRQTSTRISFESYSTHLLLRCQDEYLDMPEKNRVREATVDSKLLRIPGLIKPGKTIFHSEFKLVSVNEKQIRDVNSLQAYDKVSALIKNLPMGKIRHHISPLNV